MVNFSKKIGVEEADTGIISVSYMLKDSKKVFTFNEYIDGRWQIIGNIPLNIAKKIYLSHFSRYIWIEGREANLDPDGYATVSSEQLEIFFKNSGEKNFSIPDFVSFSKKSGYPRYIKSYDIYSKYGLEYFIKLLEDNGLVD